MRVSPSGSRAVLNRESLLRLRRRQKLERLLQGFCFRDVDLELAERRWKATQIVLSSPESYDSGEELSDYLIHDLELKIKNITGEIEATQPKAVEQLRYNGSEPFSKPNSQSPSETTGLSSRAAHALIHRPRGELDEWAMLQVPRSEHHYSLKISQPEWVTFFNFFHRAPSAIPRFTSAYPASWRRSRAPGAARRRTRPRSGSGGRSTAATWTASCAPAATPRRGPGPPSSPFLTISVGPTMRAAATADASGRVRPAARRRPILTT